MRPFKMTSEKERKTRNLPFREPVESIFKESRDLTYGCSSYVLEGSVLTALLLMRGTL